MPADVHGRIDLRSLGEAWPSDIDLVVVTHGSNVTGTVQPVAEVIDFAHRRGAAVVVDAAQTVGTLVSLDLHEADAVAFSGHKGLRALPGIGALVVRDAERVAPLVVGGTGYDANDPDMPMLLPQRLEAGTPNLPGIAALGAALADTSGRRWDHVEARRRLSEAVLAAGGTIVAEGILLVVSFTLDGCEPMDVEDALDRGYQIVTRAGLQCSGLAHRHLGTTTTGVVRVSSGLETTDAELASFTTALREISMMLRCETGR